MSIPDSCGRPAVKSAEVHVSLAVAVAEIGRHCRPTDIPGRLFSRSRVACDVVPTACSTTCSQLRAVGELVPFVAPMRPRYCYTCDGGDGHRTPELRTTFERPAADRHTLCYKFSKGSYNGGQESLVSRAPCLLVLFAVGLAVPAAGRGKSSKKAAGWQ